MPQPQKIGCKQDKPQSFMLEYTVTDFQRDSIKNIQATISYCAMTFPGKINQTMFPQLLHKASVLQLTDKKISAIFEKYNLTNSVVS